MENEKGMFSLGVRSKYIIVFLACAFVSILTIAFNSWSHANRSLTEANLQHLVSLRTERTRSIQGFFKRQKSNLKVLSASDTVVSASNEFKVAYDLISLYKIKIDAAQQKKLTGYYEDVFYKAMQSNAIDLRKLEDFTALSEPSSYLQYQYIADNPNPFAYKDLLTRKNDGSYYSEVHGKYHDQLRLVAKEYGFNDLLLIDKDEGNVVYSVYKNTDFATSLLGGPYANSSLSRVVQGVIRDPVPHKIYVQDFESYEPALGAPQIILAMPVFDQKIFTGILAVQIPMSTINNIMTLNERWEEDGLGDSGEVYLLGNDSLMRSNSRFLIENKASYLQTLKNNRENPTALRRIDLLNTSVLQQTVKTRAAVDVLNGVTGHQTVNNYYGSSVLSAYSPLNITGLKWAILAEKNMQEITSSTRDLQLTITISAVSLVILIGAFAMIYSTRFMRPIMEMLTAAKSYLNDGTFVTIKTKKTDEIGELSYEFSQLMSRLEAQQKALKAERANTHQTLLKFLPVSIASQVEGGQTRIAKLHDNVAVTFISLRGINNVIQDNPASVVVDHIDRLYDMIDSLVARHELEKLNLTSENYTLTCGLHKPRLDYSRRCVNFSIEFLSYIERYNLENNVNITPRIGIDSGQVVSGLIGQASYTYSLWGDPANIANRSCYDAKLNSIVITRSVYEQLEDKAVFSSHPSLDMPRIGTVELWEHCT